MPGLTNPARRNMSHWKLYLLALGFYTRIPVPKDQDYDQLPQASPYLPLVGWLVGGLSGLCFYLANLLWPQNVAVIITLLVGMLLTGAFHEDGLADVCDGFGGGYGKPRILEIMKDSQIGTYGALGLFMLMAIKISLLCAMSASSIPLVLMAAHSLSRFSPLVLMKTYTYARVENSKGSVAVYQPTVSDLIFAGVSAALPLLMLPLLCVFTLPAVVFVTWQLGRYFHKHIGGYTGDCLGASQQISEVVFYLTVAALWTYT